MKSKSLGDITKTLLHHGEGQLKPNWESQCIVDIDRSECDVTNGNEIKQSNRFGKNIELTIGQSDSEFSSKVEICLMTMRKGEVSKFVFDLCEAGDREELHSRSKEECQESQDSNESVSATICLHSFSHTSPSWRLNSAEKYNLALSYKTQGTELFQAGKTEAAFNRYSRAVKYLICIPELSTVSESGSIDLAETCTVSLKELKALQCICHLNLAACQAKVSNHPGVIDNCTRALALDAGSVKALYRRAVASIACGQKEKAREDLLKAQKLEPQNKAISSLLQTCRP